MIVWIIHSSNTIVFAPHWRYIGVGAKSLSFLPEFMQRSLFTICLIHTQNKNQEHREDHGTTKIDLGFQDMRYIFLIENTKNPPLITALGCLDHQFQSVKSGNARCVEELLGTCPFHFYYQTCHGRYLARFSG